MFVAYFCSAGIRSIIMTVFYRLRMVGFHVVSCKMWLEVPLFLRGSLWRPDLPWQAKKLFTMAAIAAPSHSFFHHIFWTLKERVEEIIFPYICTYTDLRNLCNKKIRYCINSCSMWSILCICLAKYIHVNKTFSMCSEGQGRKVGIAWVAYWSIKMRNNQQTLNYFQHWRRCFVLILCVAVTDFSFNLIRTMAWYISNASFTSAQMCWFHWSDPWFTLL